MENQIMVSIRCLAYNHEPYIRQCLEGFVMQKTNFRFEAIVHDDASTDGTAAIIREYAEKYPDIIKPIFEMENQYSKQDGSLRRIMDAEMRGKYIAMCEGDDYWTDPLKLQKQVDFLESHDDFCFIGAICKILKGSKLSEDVDWFQNHPQETENGISMFGDVFDYAIRGPVTRTCTLLYRRNIIENYPFQPNGDLTLMAILAHESMFARLDNCACVYRVHDSGLSNDNSYKGQLRYHQWLVDNRKLLHKMFPETCSFDEQEFIDRESYIYLRQAISSFHYREAFSSKRKLQTDNYKQKFFSRWLFGPFSFIILFVLLKIKDNI